MTVPDPIRTGDAAAAQHAESVVPAERRSADPLAGLSHRALGRLARRADRMRRRDVTRLEGLASELGTSPRRLRLLADAWIEGGPAGMVAVGPATPADERQMRRAEEIIETWRRRHFPLDALEVEVWRNRLTVWWLRTPPNPTADLVRHPLMQLRRTDEGRWHLYRRAVQGEWWPVEVRGRRRRQSLSACLDAVRVDPLHHFWGTDGPPNDLADGDGTHGWA